jgi:hypothetical protein
MTTTRCTEETAVTALEAFAATHPKPITDLDAYIRSLAARDPEKLRAMVRSAPTPARPPLALPGCSDCGAAEGSPLGERLVEGEDGRMRKCAGCHPYLRATAHAS